MMTKAEDNGENQHFQTELEIKVELYDYGQNHTSNKVIFVPVDKETNLVFRNIKNIAYFNYEKIESNDLEPNSNTNTNTNANTNTIIIIVIVIGILVLIIIIGLLYYRKKKKEKSNNIEDVIDANEKILADN